jgi:hypothetical protein
MVFGCARPAAHGRAGCPQVGGRRAPGAGDHAGRRGVVTGVRAGQATAAGGGWTHRRPSAGGCPGLGLGPDARSADRGCGERCVPGHPIRWRRSVAPRAMVWNAEARQLEAARRHPRHDRRDETFAAALAPHRSPIRTCSVTRSDSPQRSASRITGTSPTHEINRSSSNTTWVVPAHRETIALTTCPFELAGRKRRNSHPPRSEGIVHRPSSSVLPRRHRAALSDWLTSNTSTTAACRYRASGGHRRTRRSPDCRCRCRTRRRGGRGSRSGRRWGAGRRGSRAAVGCRPCRPCRPGPGGCARGRVGAGGRGLTGRVHKAEQPTPDYGASRGHCRSGRTMYQAPDGVIQRRSPGQS